MKPEQNSQELPVQRDRGSAGPPMTKGLTMITEIFGFSRTMAISTVLIVGSLLLAAVFYVFSSAPPKDITIASGPEGSVYETNAVKYALRLKNHGIRVKILRSQGAIQNLDWLTDPSVQVDVGFVQGGVTNNAMEKLMSLGSISYQPLLVFYRGAPVELMSSFLGKRLAIGPAGSGTHSLALTLLQTNSIKSNDVVLLDWDPGQSAQALLNGSVDAVFLMGESASPAVMRELLRAPDVHLMSFGQADAYSRRITYLSVMRLPQGSIDLGKNIPNQDINLIGPTVELVARKKLHPALSDLLLEAAREVHGNASILQRKGEFPAPMEHDLALSPDALRFYKSGKTFFYRYLPFWLASLTSRLVVAFVPLIVVLIPILRSIPPIYRWRIRSRTFRWYRALLALERESFGELSLERRRHLLDRLDEVERAVNRMKVPASFANEFYSLRGHILFVRHLINSALPQQMSH